MKVQTACSLRFVRELKK